MQAALFTYRRRASRPIPFMAFLHCTLIRQLHVAGVLGSRNAIRCQHAAATERTKREYAKHNALE